MKKTKLTRSLLAACSIVALSAVMYGCVHSGDGPSQSELDAAEAAAAAAAAEAAAAAQAQEAAEAEAAAAAQAQETAEAEAAEAAEAQEAAEAEAEAAAKAQAEAEAQAAADLEETQAAAAEAAMAAMTASTEAAASAMSATEETANIATLQTGGKAASYAEGARDAATDAMAAYMAAKAASDMAADADNGPDAEAAWAMAVSAQGDAEDAAMMAAEMSEDAIEAAKMELHIDGTMKWVDIVDDDGNVTGMRSVDAAMGHLIDYDDDGEVTMRTGFQYPVRRDIDPIEGQAFEDNEGETETTPLDPSDDVTYRQAVAAQTLEIGKVVDSTDDMARLTIVTGRASTEMVRVFALADEDGTATFQRRHANDMVDVSDAQDGSVLVELKSIGMFHEAEPVDGATGAVTDGLDFTDEIPTGSEEVEVFSYVSGNPATTTYVVVEAKTTNSDGDIEGWFLRAVDIEAAAAVPDTLEDTDALADEARVMATLPMLEAYSHIHFGVWASLMDNEDGDNYMIGDLGIGFVQNISGEGVTSAHVTGTASYSGDWVAVVRPSYSSSLSVEDGHATLTANFSTDEFTADLEDLAMLEGTLSGNTFSGTDAMVNHEDMDGDGDFDGSFSGAIYGDDGAEAAGVFSFDGDDAGAFVGAFGGRDDDQ